MLSLLQPNELPAHERVRREFYVGEALRGNNGPLYNYAMQLRGHAENGFWRPAQSLPRAELEQAVLELDQAVFDLLTNGDLMNSFMEQWGADLVLGWQTRFDADVPVPMWFYPGFEFDEPLPLPVPAVPLPGHAIRLTGEWWGAKPNSIAIIDGALKQLIEGELLAVFRASAYRDRKGAVDCSGGPCPFVKVTDLRYSGTYHQATFWRWRDTPRAGGGVKYQLWVPLWEWPGQQ